MKIEATIRSNSTKYYFMGQFMHFTMVIEAFYPHCHGGTTKPILRQEIRRTFALDSTNSNHNRRVHVKYHALAGCGEAGT